MTMTSRTILTLVLALALLLAGCGDGEESTTDGTSNTTVSRGRDVAPETVDDSALRDPVDVDAIEIAYGETEDELLRGYFVYPSDMVEPLPAVIVVHEWWGLNDAVRKAATKIAEQGYMVLAVDLFQGQTASSTADASALARQLLETPGFAEKNLRAAHGFLTEAAGAPTVATLGWSLGGYWAVEATRFLPDQFAAAVVYYGQPDADPDMVSAISAPGLGRYGGADRSIPAESVRAFREQAQALDKSVEVIIYPKANHGFANPDDSRYANRTAEQAWRRTAAFLDRYLRTS